MGPLPFTDIKHTVVPLYSSSKLSQMQKNILCRCLAAGVIFVLKFLPAFSTQSFANTCYFFGSHSVLQSFKI